MNAFIHKNTRKSGTSYSVRLVETDSTGKKKESWLNNPDTGKPFVTKKEAEAFRPYGIAIHPTAYTSDAQIGPGTVIMAGVIIQPGCRIGKHVILNTGCQLDHDCVIEDFAHIAPGAVLCGNVHVG